jgi:hypothetical protein
VAVVPYRVTPSSGQTFRSRGVASPDSKKAARRRPLTSCRENCYGALQLREKGRDPGHSRWVPSPEEKRPGRDAHEALLFFVSAYPQHLWLDSLPPSGVSGDLSGLLPEPGPVLVSHAVITVRCGLETSALLSCATFPPS